MQFLIDNKNSHDPSVNLALEEYAVRNLHPQNEYILLYINDESVILGRHQNAWEEINLNYIKNNLIQVVRRISGGGTVYQDFGNLNFSYITNYEKWKFNNYRLFTTPIINALLDLNIKAELNNQNAIVVGNKKISGNAQFTKRNSMISHGTLLFNSDLDRLARVLEVKKKNIKSRAIKSIPSPVANISDFLKSKMSITGFKKHLINHLFSNAKQIPVFKFSKEEWKEILLLAEKKYQTWDWNFGESPQFTIANFKDSIDGKQETEITIKNGKIIDIKISSNLKISKSMINSLKNIPYREEDIMLVLLKLQQVFKNKEKNIKDLSDLILEI